MTSASDSAEISALVGEAVRVGAGRGAACEEIGLHPRTLSRWSGPEGAIRPDLRPTAERPVPAKRLSAAERDRIVEICASPEFASLPPSQIVPQLPDQGCYIASESSFYRVLRECDQNHRRGRARPATRHKPRRASKRKARARSGRGT